MARTARRSAVTGHLCVKRGCTARGRANPRASRSPFAAGGCQCFGNTCSALSGRSPVPPLWPATTLAQDLRDPSLYGPDYGVSDLDARAGYWASHTEGSPVKVGEYQDLRPSPFYDLDMLRSDGNRTLNSSVTGTDQETNALSLNYFGPALEANVELPGLHPQPGPRQPGPVHRLRRNQQQHRQRGDGHQYPRPAVAQAGRRHRRGLRHSRAGVQDELQGPVDAGPQGPPGRVGNVQGGGAAGQFHAGVLSAHL